MWFPTDNQPKSNHNTPRTDRRLPKLDRPGGVSGWTSDISKTSKASKEKEAGPSKPAANKPAQSTAQKGAPPPGEKPFFVEDDRRSKITVVSLKSARTNRTVQTMQSTLTPRTVPREPAPKGAKGAMIKAKKKIKDGFRESSIKRIIAAGLCVAACLLYLFGVFLPFWSVYTSTSSGVTTGYYGGLWNYCTRTTSDGTDCTMFKESDLSNWFRTARGLELLGFMCMVALMGVVIAYIFFFREIKYGFMQWIIVGLCFATALLSFTGLVVYGAGESDSSRLSSAYGLTFCAFIGVCLAGAIFLWDKIKQGEMIRKKGFRGLSGIPSSRPGHRRSRLSHVRGNRSTISRGTSQKSVAHSVAPSVPQSTRLGANPSTVSQLAPPKET